MVKGDQGIVDAAVLEVVHRVLVTPDQHHTKESTATKVVEEVVVLDLQVIIVLINIIMLILRVDGVVN